MSTQGTSYLLNDAAVSPAAFALPNGAAATSSAGIDTGNTDGQFLAECELLISLPALNTTQMPDAKTLTCKIEHDTDSAFGTVTTVYDKVLIVTGAGGAGCAAATARAKLPTNVKRYVRVTITGSASGNSSTANATVQVLF